MKTTTINQKPAAGKKAPKPITLTIDAELAGKVRESAKALGMSPANAAKLFVRDGEFSSSPTAEARRSRIERGLNEMLNSGLVGVELSARLKGDDHRPAFTQPPDLDGERLPVWLPADDVRLLREVCAAGGIETGDEFVQGMVASLAEETLKSQFRRSSGSVVGSFGLLDAAINADEDNTDFDALERMQAVVDRWNAKEGRADA